MFTVPGEPEIVREARLKILSEFGDLEFQEEGHRYFLHGREITLSVSAVGHKFIRCPFDEKLQAQRYAEKHGNTAQHWIQQCHMNAFRATTLGTKTHEYGESLSYLKAGHPELIRNSVRTQYMEELNYLAPIHPKEEAVEKFLSELPPCMHLVLNETKVYSGKNPDPEMNLKELICGTFDMLYYFDGNGNPDKAGFVILDYKTNQSLESEFNRKFGRTLLPPFSKMVEEDLSLYTIQLSLYSLMLEDIGIPVIARRLVWLQNDGNYKFFTVPDVSLKLRQVL